ncbi:MAG TPA: double-strand break repair protein AddB [Rhizomicrobium sp.]|jgi:ATP-dependent helicase/nuclease subunit B
MPNVFTIPSSAPFARTLARGLIAQVDLENDKLALAKTTIYLPTRRAVRDFPEVFARELGGAALLPEMRPLGDVDEDEFLFDASSEDLALPPAISPIRRRLLLAQLVRRFRQDTAPLTFAQAASLAGGLAKFFDDAQTEGVDLSKLEKIVPDHFAGHWRKVWEFLDIVRQNWPAILQAEGAMDPSARRNAMLAALAARLEKNPPQGPVIAAGSTGSIPATANLLRVIANLPNGSVILPGLDRELDEDSWNELEPGHPQYGLKKLLGGIGVTRQDVRNWQPLDGPGNLPREKLLREVLRPAPTTDAWRAIAEKGADDIAKGLAGLSIVEAAHPGEEATAIALILRGVLEDKGKTAALVTPDRNLARRVAAELRRWNIEIDDTAGRPLANTPPGTFLSLLAEGADEHFAPVQLLALLKHPLASGGENTAGFRRNVRALDRLLRGPRPDPGLGGIAHAIKAAEQDARERKTGAADSIAALGAWFAKLAKILQPIEDCIGTGEAAIADLTACHIEAAEKLAATDTQDGKSILWRGEAGNSAAELAAALALAAQDIGPVEASSYPVLFRALAEQRAVRPTFGRHPRLAILGPLEARLQHYDTVVLGGLNEGAWPRAANVDPWLSRPMREKLGLEQPERDIGLSAHDFASLAAGPRVILTRALKAEGSPTIPSRWLQRLWQLTTGLGIVKELTPDEPYEHCARALGEPAKPAERMKPPRPKPPLAQRPNNLSVTEIETWLRDPYAIYARHVLGLRPLDPLDAEIGPLERGTSVHKALEKFMEEFRDHLPEDAAPRLIEISRQVFADAGIPKSALAVWQPRFIRAAHWFTGEERKRRSAIKDIYLEIAGQREFPGGFILRCRADRVDVLRNGSAAIIDYKTGEPPSDKQVKTLTPQLPLEASILAAGGFKDIGARETDELIYIRFSGDASAGKIRWLKDVKTLIATAEADLTDLIALFADENHPYLSRVRPFRADQPGDYDHLARVREWSLTGWESEA